uniref:Uncharacterized protein n=1 Tax=Oryza punctata TaxID=4537 RepID=A0A0E0LV00_ORYPU
MAAHMGGGADLEWQRGVMHGRGAAMCGEKRALGWRKLLCEVAAEGRSNAASTGAFAINNYGSEPTRKLPSEAAEACVWLGNERHG